MEATSGNIGIGLSFIATSRGYKLILTIPMPMNMAKRFLPKVFGFKLVLTYAEIPNKTLKSGMLKQFNNPVNPTVTRAYNSMCRGTQVVSNPLAQFSLS